jgi:hypothetical protein
MQSKLKRETSTDSSGVFTTETFAPGWSLWKSRAKAWAASGRASHTTRPEGREGASAKRVLKRSLAMGFPILPRPIKLIEVAREAIVSVELLPAACCWEEPELEDERGAEPERGSIAMIDRHCLIW